MTCGDLINLIKQNHFEDAEIFYIDCEYDSKTGYLSLARNYKVLPYPEFRNLFDDGPAEEYTQITLDFNMNNGVQLGLSEEYCNTSTEEFYPY